VGSPYVGEIRMFGVNFAPQGWAFCNGQLLPISEYSELFNLIGTTYGGDGVNTFALPNLQSRVPVHIGSGFVLGAIGGAETVTLTVAQIPAHTHIPSASSAAGTQASPANGVWAGSSSDVYSNTAPMTNMAANAIGSTGGSQPHDNMLPFLAVSFILSLFGIYPTQS
jgi:microcystin-dependent protein